MNEETPQIKYDTFGHALRLTLSNPGKKNAISRDMYQGLTDALNAAATDDSIRVVWLRGADGDFTSGNLVQDFNQTVLGESPAVVQFLRAIMTFPKPIVAEVEGVAVGVGTTMLLHCDLIYAAPDARFRLPFVNLGLVPEAGSSYVLPRLVGQAKAAELLLLGRMFSADEARDAGMISAVVPEDALTQTVQDAVEALCAQPPQAVRKTKALLRKPLEGALWDRVEEEFVDFAAGLEGEEFREAFAAFIEKRAPVFK